MKEAVSTSGDSSKELQKQAQILTLFDQWLADDSSEDEVTWEEVKRELERNRLSSRRLFGE